jgi:OOP family OmpA-OmpF porin
VNSKTGIMSRKAIYLLGIVLTILLGTWLYVLFCCNNCCLKVKEDLNSKSKALNNVENESKTAFSKNGFGFTTSNLHYSCADNFTFNFSDGKIILPISDSIDLGISKLKTVLDSSDLKFTIKGFYSSKEENNSIFPDLGLARANAIKNYLVDKGIPEHKLELFSEINDKKLIIDDNIVYQSTSFGWLSKDINSAEKKDWNVVRNEIKVNPLELYFETGQSIINLTEADRKKLGVIVDYLNHVSDAKIAIVGHTDNVVGKRNTNEFYSKKRAEFVQNYFISNGIPAQKIEVFGKGAANPITENETEEGRAKNRRVEVTIK